MAGRCPFCPLCVPHPLPACKAACLAPRGHTCMAALHHQAPLSQGRLPSFLPITTSAVGAGLAVVRDGNHRSSCLIAHPSYIRQASLHPTCSAACNPYGPCIWLQALGCLLYEMATHSVPFEARSMNELRYKVMKGRWVALHSLSLSLSWMHGIELPQPQPRPQSPSPCCQSAAAASNTHLSSGVACILTLMPCSGLTPIL